ncbi:c-type cytochrome [Thiomicrorhabdus cannonii]|uniref:c-type cytochrome n=1 Tax=Thiomicrorhabdus cannonii TaxID=2748011 RepID=UPI0015B9CF53|nr:c-type cytochrome [Thiomicrorhabdus cannonii]
MKKAKLGFIAKAALVAGGMLASNVAFAGIDRAEMLANTCAGCHGPNGVSHGPATPSIAGISKDYFIESMNAYASGSRPSTIMMRIAKGYTEADIAAMAEYFSKQHHQSAVQAVNDSLVQKGEKLHNKYCEKCHSEGGSLASDDAGILAGQWKPYLQYNLHDFTSGSREAPKKMAKQLKAMHDKYGQEGVDQLIEFYSSK